MKRRVRSGQTNPQPSNPGTGQQRVQWHFCTKCLSRVRRGHIKEKHCTGTVYEMEGYVQLLRKNASDRAWRLWIGRFCQPFRHVK